MNRPVEIGSPVWTRDQMRARLEEFAALYEARPVRDNKGGMRSPHLFLAWFVLKALSPSAIIESGVWKGQGTWLFEQACPDAELHCIDPNLGQIAYRSDRATYYDRDFSTLDWLDLPRDETLVFFDDHQNAYERLKTSHWFGFKHLLFEDNYPAGRGDCYSLKHAWAHAGHSRSRPLLSLRGALRAARRIVSPRRWDAADVPPNDVDAHYMEQRLEIYAELPPTFRPSHTRWGDAWDPDRYPTPEPLLASPTEPYHEPYYRESRHYTWMCYLKLK